MADYSDQWLWFVDEELVEKLTKPEEEPLETEAARPAETRATAKALALHQEGKTKQALETLARAIEKGEELADLYLMAGAIRLETQQWEGAAANFANLVALEPEHRSAHHNLGIALARCGRFEEAAAAFEKSRSISPQLWQSSLGLGVCRLETGHPQAAFDAFQACLEQHPQSDKALFGRAVALQQLGRLEESHDAYRKILPDNPNNPEILNNLVALSVARKDHSRLREYADRLLKVRPQSRAALEGLVAASFGRGDFKSAGAVRPATGEGRPRTRRKRGSTWASPARTSAVWTRPSKLTKSRSGIKEDAAVTANLALVREESGDVTGARKAHERAIELAPQDPRPLWNLSLFYEKQGEAEEAELSLEQLIELNTDWHQAWFRLGPDALGARRPRLGDRSVRTLPAAEARVDRSVPEPRPGVSGQRRSGERLEGSGARGRGRQHGSAQGDGDDGCRRRRRRHRRGTLPAGKRGWDCNRRNWLSTSP